MNNRHPPPPQSFQNSNSTMALMPHMEMIKRNDKKVYCETRSCIFLKNVCFSISQTVCQWVKYVVIYFSTERQKTIKLQQVEV